MGFFSSWKLSLISLLLSASLGVALYLQIQVNGERQAENAQLQMALSGERELLRVAVNQAIRASHLVAERDDEINVLRERKERVRTVIKTVLRDPVSRDWSEVALPGAVRAAAIDGLVRLRGKAGNSNSRGETISTAGPDPPDT